MCQSRTTQEHLVHLERIEKLLSVLLYPSQALRAAGAVCSAVDALIEGNALRAFCAVRPPGHHATRDQPMGFCLFNNVAVGAAQALARGVDRVAIVDFDVHHGNGTQAAFYEDPTVLYVSSHQFPYYPGTGAADEIGRGAGRGFTLNLPMDAGSTDADFARLYEARVVPALDAFRPDVLLVSAGYDAHELDPLAGMRMTAHGFTWLVSLLDDAANRLCGRRLALVTEGGYHLDALRECLDATVDVIS